MSPLFEGHPSERRACQEPRQVHGLGILSSVFLSIQCRFCLDTNHDVRSSLQIVPYLRITLIIRIFFNSSCNQPNQNVHPYSPIRPSRIWKPLLNVADLRTLLQPLSSLLLSNLNTYLHMLPDYPSYSK